MQSNQNQPDKAKPAYALALHGGAGTLKREGLAPDLEAALKAILTAALQAGEAVLTDGGSALDAVTAAIRVMEDSEHLNAGRGAVFTADGKNELDSSIMDGRTLDAGAVSGVANIKNPILLARAVMENSPHVMLQGDGANRFAAEAGIETAPDEYFFTDHRWQQLEDARARGPGAVLDHDGGPATADDKFGTVGAAALDTFGNLAAGTSTGGMTNKSFGRVGDSPIIGAGTYASNESCAVSATGHGEFFIRAAVARDICALMEYGGMSLQEAADTVVMKRLPAMGGDGGIVAVDKAGAVSLTFNTPCMFRGKLQAGQAPMVALFED